MSVKKTDGMENMKNSKKVAIYAIYVLISLFFIIAGFVGYFHRWVYLLLASLIGVCFICLCLSIVISDKINKIREKKDAERKLRRKQLKNV